VIENALERIGGRYIDPSWASSELPRKRLRRGDPAASVFAAGRVLDVR
jgi:hypothetical protein